MSNDPLYKVTWEEMFEQFVASVEEYVELELPADASPAEHKLQEDMRKHLQTYKEAKAKEEEDD